MNGAIVALVIMTGAGCSSQLEQQLHMTTAYKVPCAIVLREQSANPFKVAQQPNTITPPTKVVPKYEYKPKKKKKRKKRR